jgi:hypothetical protein
MVADGKSALLLAAINYTVIEVVYVGDGHLVLFRSLC